MPLLIVACIQKRYTNYNNKLWWPQKIIKKKKKAHNILYAYVKLVITQKTARAQNFKYVQNSRADYQER